MDLRVHVMRLTYTRGLILFSKCAVQGCEGVFQQRLLLVNPRMFYSKYMHIEIIRPRRDKTCLRGFRQRENRTNLLNNRDYAEHWNFACSKYIYDAFQKANDKCADQTARMRRLVWAFEVRKPQRQFFPRRGPDYKEVSHTSQLISQTWYQETCIAETSSDTHKRDPDSFIHYHYTEA